jgi:hypothetical protein
LKFGDGDPGGKAKNLEKKSGCRRRIEEKSKPACHDPVRACGTQPPFSSSSDQNKFDCKWIDSNLLN